MAGEKNAPVAKSCTVTATSRNNYRTELLFEPLAADQSITTGKIIDPATGRVESYLNPATLSMGPAEAASDMVKLKVQSGSRDVALKCDF